MAHQREIERKFLVNRAIWEKEGLPLAKKLLFQQGYIARSEGRVVRVRSITPPDSPTLGVLTIKLARSEDRLARDEFEYPLPPEEAQLLLNALAPEEKLVKTRHSLTVHGKLWVVDEFHQPHVGLLLAEIELASTDETFQLPNWLGEEVTHLPGYTSARLAMGTPLPVVGKG